MMDQQVAETDRMASDEDPSWLPAWRLAERIARREISPVDVMEHFLRRIETLDPRAHAFRAINPETARLAAHEAERMVARGEALGPLHGVPVALKEHIQMGGMHWHDLRTNTIAIATRDGPEVERLRRAGAIPLGMTVAGLTAVEFGASDRQPLNPWDRNRICGDSSSGSACAVASGLVPIAIAIDGLGSTRLPAAYSGLVGLMPTRGRVPNFTWGDLPTGLLNVSGPLARDVRDAALVFSVLAGPDARDFGSLPDAAPDVLSGLDGGVSGMRLLWSDDLGYASAFASPESAEVIETIHTAAMKLAGVGATIDRMGGAFDDPTAACDIALVSDPAMFIFAKQPDEVLAVAREVRAKVTAALQEKLRDADFILCPTSQQIAPTLQQWADHWGSDSGPKNHMPNYTAYTGFMNLIGWPAISIPAGLVRGVPIGLQIIGKPNSEPAMLRLAQAFGQLVDIGRPAISM